MNPVIASDKLPRLNVWGEDDKTVNWKGLRHMRRKRGYCFLDHRL